MNKKIILVLLILITLVGSTFAATLTTQAPTANEFVSGGRTYVIDMNIITQDANGTEATTVPKLDIYYSIKQGELEKLIYQDTNLFDGVGVICADYNFFYSQDCNFSWSIPSAPTVSPGYYYIDYNLSEANYLGGGRTDNAFSSSRFQLNQPLAPNIAAMIALALFIVAAGLAVFGVFGLANDMNIVTFTQMIIVAIVLLVIAWTMYGSIVAV